MTKQTVNTDMLSKKSEDIFDNYYNLIENAKLQHLRTQSEEPLPDYEIFVRALMILERNIQDLASNKSLTKKNFKVINDSVIHCLTEWYFICTVLIQQEQFIFAISYNIIAIAILIAQSANKELLQVRKDIIFLSPSKKEKEMFLHIQNEGNDPFDKISKIQSALKNFKGKNKNLSKKEIIENIDLLSNLINDATNPVAFVQARLKLMQLDITQNFVPHFHFMNQVVNPVSSGFQILELNKNYKNEIFPFIDLNQFKDLEESKIEFLRNVINNNDIHSAIDKIRYSNEYEYVWDIKIIMKDEPYNSSKIGFLMWSFSQALQAIDGVKVELDDWGNGSKWYNLKARINDFLGREEVKEILDKGRKAAEAKILEKPVEETGKIKAEKEKLIKETENLLDKEEAKLLHQLDIEKKQLEIYEKKVDIASKVADVDLKRIQVMKGYSDLLRDGIIENNSSFQIMINGLPFLERKDGQIKLGEHIDIISESGARIEKTESKIKDEPTGEERK